MVAVRRRQVSKGEHSNVHRCCYLPPKVLLLPCLPTCRPVLLVPTNGGQLGWQQAQGSALEAPKCLPLRLTPRPPATRVPAARPHAAACVALRWRPAAPAAAQGRRAGPLWLPACVVTAQLPREPQQVSSGAGGGGSGRGRLKLGGLLRSVELLLFCTFLLLVGAPAEERLTAFELFRANPFCFCAGF